MRGATASGVRSVGVTPVPPVVTTTLASASSSAVTVSAIAPPSGTIVGSATVKPRSRNQAAIVGPVRSSEASVAACVDTTTTPARPLVGSDVIERSSPRSVRRASRAPGRP